MLPKPTSSPAYPKVSSKPRAHEGLAKPVPAHGRGIETKLFLGSFQPISFHEICQFLQNPSRFSMGKQA